MTMCRLFGLRANRPVDIEFSLVTGHQPFQKLGEKHPNGWGIGWYDNGTPKVTKEPIPATASEELGPLAKHVESSLIISHLRKATCGEVTEANCHPFQHHNWLFAHNGSVDRGALWKKLNDSHRGAIHGRTDSEVFFHWILQNVEKTESVERGLRTALNGMTGFTGLNFLLADGRSLYAYRNASKNRDYYSLFYLRRDLQAQGLEELRSKEVQALLCSKALRGEKAVLVCSEKLTDEAWKEIPLGSLLVVSEDLSPQVVEVK
jgi:glutamine amidotransferase